MKIIHAPHQTLRKKVTPVEHVDQKLRHFIDSLTDTLVKKDNPKGVGLSAPQVDHSVSVFCTYLSPSDEEEPIIHTFINPEIVGSSKERTFGDDPERPILEGCLSIPGLYGPVPRFSWVELKYQIIDQDTLKTKYSTLYEFEARVVQHELDHLQGILFTDYILEFDLPLYDDTSGKMVKISNNIAKKF